MKQGAFVICCQDGVIWQILRVSNLFVQITHPENHAFTVTFRRDDFEAMFAPVQVGAA